MRRAPILFFLLAAGCSSASEPAPGDDSPGFGPPSGGPTADTTSPSPTPTAPATDPPDPPGPPLDPDVDPATRSNPEEVYVVMSGFDGWTWFCTGTLIAKDVALTAAHCLDPSQFASYEVIAPTLASHPHATASRVAIYDYDWDDIAHPDLGIIVLATPIELGRYGVLTDVSARVDAAQSLSASAIVRTAEQPEAALHGVGPMPLASAAADGYSSSYGVPLFSNGGDSGAGLFLVENGKPTHKVVAVEHTPDPARGLDHASRIDAAFVQWVAEKSAAP